MKHRVCYIEISAPSGIKQIKNIAIKGSVTRRMGSVAAEAKVSIANLAKDDIEYLSTYMSSYVEPDKRKELFIYAGYEDSGSGLIFHGDIIRAEQEGMPDTWLNIEAKTNYFNRQNVITYSVTSPVTTKQMAQNVAAQLGVSLSWKTKSQKLIDSVNFVGAKAKLVEELNKYGDFVAFLDNNVLKVVDKDEDVPAENVTGSNNSSSSKKTDGYVKLVNSSSGLVGIPQATEYGAKFKVLLDPTLNPADWVRLESEKFPAINDYYQIYNLKFDFSSREKNFYCEIECKNYKRNKK